MSKQNVAVVLLLVGVGALVLYVISSSGGRESELAKPDISVPADIRALEDETTQLARPAPVVNDPPPAAATDETDPDAAGRAAIEAPESGQAQFVPPERAGPGKGRGRGPKVFDPAKEEEKATREASKLAERLGLEEWQSLAIADLMLDEKRRKSELEELKRSGALSREEVRDFEKQLKEQTKLAIESMLTAEQLELYQQKGKGGPGGR